MAAPQNQAISGLPMTKDTTIAIAKNILTVMIKGTTRRSIFSLKLRFNLKKLGFL